MTIRPTFRASTCRLFLKVHFIGTVPPLSLYGMSQVTATDFYNDDI